jgi:uncharacterized protein involved in exopolysaccharide biosynthesis
METQTNEITLLDLAKILKSTLRFLYSYKIVIISFVLVGAISLYFVGKNKLVNYISKSTLILESQNETSQLGSLAAQFGMGSSSNLTEDKLLLVSSSSTVVKNTLFNKAIVNGKNDFLINHIISSKAYLSKFNINPKYSYDSINYNSKTGDTLLKNVIHLVKHNYTTESEIPGSIELKAEFESEDLSYSFNNILVKELNKFFIESSISLEQKNLEQVRIKADSLNSLLKVNERKLAQLKDSRINMIKVQGFVDELIIEREIIFLAEMYSESLKTQEVLRLKLMLKKPAISIIDSPQRPLSKVTPNLKLFIIGGVFLGLFLSLLIAITHTFYKNFYKKIN